MVEESELEEEEEESEEETERLLAGLFLLRIEVYYFR
jgi:hypothetical protein